MRPIIRNISYALIPVLLAFGTGIKAQQKWSIEECINYAQEQNINIKRQSLAIQSAKSNLLTAKASRLPGFSAFASHNLSSGKTVNFEDYSYINTEYQDGGMGIRGDITLFNGLAILNTVKQQKYAMLAAISETETLRNSIAIQVTGSFLQVLFAHELYLVAKEQHQLSLDQLASTTVFFEEGIMAKANLLEVKAKASQDALAMVQAENQENDAKLQLAHLMNISNPNDFEISYPAILGIDKSTLLNPEQVYSNAVKSLPRIRGAEMRVKASESGLAATRSLLSPRIVMDGMYYSRYSELGINPLDPTNEYPYSKQLSDNGYSRLSLSLDIPIFRKFQTKNQINQAKITALDAKYALDFAKITLKQEIQTAYSDARNALAKYEASTTAVEFTEESHSFVQERFKSGLATSIDLGVSQNQLIFTKSNLLQAKYEYIMRSKILDFYRGNAISL